MSLSEPARIQTKADLARALGELRRRHARQRRDSELSYRELAAKTGYAHGAIGDYFSGKRLPPTDRFDVLVKLLGATPEEQGVLATARDRVHDNQRDGRPEPHRPPRELRADIPSFIGRQAELAELDQLLAGANAEETSTVVISAVCGTAGVGKTALATHWAHRVRDQFPDGDLYVDLRGYDPDKPLASTKAIGGILRRLGVSAGAIPQEQSERAALYRTVMGGRRMLLVLDNASSVDQVRDLLPSTPSCFVIVTSRDSLAGLVAGHGAHRINLDLLPVDEAVALLRAVLGTERVDAAPEAAVELAQRCARLPLALRIAAELAVARPTVTLAQLTEELSSQELDTLDAGDEHTAVRAVFSWSYKHLPDDAARAFRVLGLHPGRDIDAYATAALIGTTVAAARRLLGILVKASLVTELSPGRFSMHDLLRAYALELVKDEPVVRRRHAVHQLFDHYLRVASAAVDVLVPDQKAERPDFPPPADPAVIPRDADAAMTWLEAERPNLMSMAVHAARDGRPDDVIALSAVLFRYLDTRGYYSDGMYLHTLAMTVAHKTGDASLEGQTLHRIGTVHMRLGHHANARDYLAQALQIAAESNDTTLECRVLQSLGVVCVRLGRYAESIAHLERALPLAESIGNKPLQGHVLRNIAFVSRRLGRYRHCHDSLSKALSLCREMDVDNREALNLEGHVLNGFALLYRRLGRDQQAFSYVREALRLAKQTGHRDLESDALNTLGALDSRKGKYAESAAIHHRSLLITRDTGNRDLEGYALIGLGRAISQQGDFTGATAHLERALALAQETGNRGLECVVLDSLGMLTMLAGEPERAIDHHRMALTVASDVGDDWRVARAHKGLANAYAALGRGAEADNHRAQGGQFLAKLDDL